MSTKCQENSHLLPSTAVVSAYDSDDSVRPLLAATPSINQEIGDVSSLGESSVLTESTKSRRSRARSWDTDEDEETNVKVDHGAPGTT